METKGLFQFFQSQMFKLTLSALFEYLCHGSTAFINILILSVRGTSSHVRIDVRF